MMNPLRKRWQLIITVHAPPCDSVTSGLTTWSRKSAEWYGNSITTQLWSRNGWIANYEVRRLS